LEHRHGAFAFIAWSRGRALAPPGPALSAAEVQEAKNGRRSSLLTCVEAFLDAIRWGAASIADTRQLQSPFHSPQPCREFHCPFPLYRHRQITRHSSDAQAKGDVSALR